MGYFVTAGKRTQAPYGIKAHELPVIKLTAIVLVGFVVVVSASQKDGGKDDSAAGSESILVREANLVALDAPDGTDGGAATGGGAAAAASAAASAEAVRAAAVLAVALATLGLGPAPVKARWFDALHPLRCPKVHVLATLYPQTRSSSNPAASWHFPVSCAFSHRACPLTRRTPSRWLTGARFWTHCCAPPTATITRARARARPRRWPRRSAHTGSFRVA